MKTMKTTPLRKIRPHAAGIDLGSEEIFVAVEEQPVRRFETFTAAMAEAVAYLKSHSIETVAMEATGIYWIPLYELLEKASIEVYLVNGAHLKQVPGRKSDLSDCQWIQQLHSCGLLSAGFVPPEQIRTLRQYWRLREDHIELAAQHILHMQKALELMNIKLHKVISQLTGASGLRIIEAILAGERDAERLAELCDGRILANKRERVVLSLEGHYRAEHLFALTQALAGWRFYQGQIAECDRAIAAWLAEHTADLPEQPLKGKPKPIHHNPPQIENLHGQLMQLTAGIDPTIVCCLNDRTILGLIAETGLDMTKWSKKSNFYSWLGLAPKTDTSGKRRRKRRQPHNNRAGQIFREAAQSLATTKHPALAGFYRRLRARRGPQVANKAAARKLAGLYYDLMRYGRQYIEQGMEEYEREYKHQQVERLTKQAQALGLQVIAA